MYPIHKTRSWVKKTFVFRTKINIYIFIKRGIGEGGSIYEIKSLTFQYAKSIDFNLCYIESHKNNCHYYSKILKM